MDEASSIDEELIDPEGAAKILTVKTITVYK